MVGDRPRTWIKGYIFKSQLLLSDSGSFFCDIVIKAKLKICCRRAGDRSVKPGGMRSATQHGEDLKRIAPTNVAYCCNADSPKSFVCSLWLFFFLYAKFTRLIQGLTSLITMF